LDADLSRTSLKGDNTQPSGAEVSNGPVDTPLHSKSKGKASAKGSVGKTKGKQKGRPAKEVENGKDDGPGTQVERRAARVVAEDSLKYTADTMRCPLPGCDSKGTELVNYSDTCTVGTVLVAAAILFQCTATCRCFSFQSMRVKHEQSSFFLMFSA